MFLPLDASSRAALIDFCERSEDCERLCENELVLDLYQIARPLSLDLVLEAEGARVDGAFYLGYDEELEGYYLSEPAENPQALLDALREAGALKA